MSSRATFLILLTLIAAVTLGGCSRIQLYEAAINHERSAADLTLKYVQVGDLNIAYLTNTPRAKAPTLVMIHGFGANKDNWVRMAAPLSEHYNLYAIDLPGHGDSSKNLDLGYTIEDQVGYLHRILQTLGLGPMHMIGNSMGGAITALYAATYPDDIRSATLIDPAGVFEYDSELVNLVKQGENPLIVKQPGDFERLVDFALEQKPFVPWPIYSVMEDKALANQAVNERIFAAIRDSGYEPAFRQSLQRIAAPVLVLWGQEDRVINVRNAAVFMQQIPHAEKVILDGVGHAAMVEIPVRTAHLVDDFVTRAEAAPASPSGG